jgi:RNA polymerase sigma-70 factor (ECF subfamily)
MEVEEANADAGDPLARAMRQEPDLVAAARDDRAAFAAVYETYRAPVYRYLRSLVPSDDAAADLTAATFERALRGIGSYRASGSGIGWLLRIARNAAIDASRRRGSTVSWDDPAARRLAASDPPLDEAAVAGERLTELRELVRGLAPPTRDALALRYGSGLSTREIAGVVGRSEAATQKLISRGLAALKEAHRERR